MKDPKEEKRNDDQQSDEYYDSQIYRVDPKQKPLRIDKFLVDRLWRASRNRIQSALRGGSITVNEQEVKPNYKVRPGDEIRVVIPRPPGEGVRVVPQDIPLDIVYEDDDLLLVNKPAGMVVHPGVGHRRGTLVNALAWYLRDRELPVMEGNYPDRMGLVHRIDKNTSGLLVVAKSEDALTGLAKQFYQHTIERTYYALVWGEPDPPKGTIELNVGRHPRFRQQFTTFPEGDDGKWAVTHYQMLEPLYYVSLIKLNLETGRTHQIRVHMKSQGHPLFGDEKYGGDRIHKGTIFSKYKTFVENTFLLMPRHALHAKSLGFVHPRTGEFMQFESDLPEDFEAALQRWRTYVQARKSTQGLS